MTRDIARHTVALGYLQAKLAVLRSPFGGEVLVHDRVSPHEMSETDLLRECAWAILSCGMAEHVVRGVFDRVSKAFFEWSSAHAIANDGSRCVSRARQAFDNPRKLHAIVAVADSVAQRGFDECVRSLHSDPIQFLSSFSYLGPASARHAAKNLGFVFAKPDRHLLNLASLLGYSTPDVLCGEIADLTGESVRVVDIVLWRFCAMQKGGPQSFVRLLD
jgi:hypothetical protein